MKSIIARYKSDLLAIAYILILVIIFFLPLFWPSSKILVSQDIGLSDAWHDGYSKKYILWSAIRQRTIPLWSQYLGSGFPLLGEGQTGVFYPASWVYDLFFSPTISYNLTLATGVLVLGWGMYAWLRKIGLSCMPSLFGGVTIAFSGVAIPQLVHIMHISGLAFIPWALFCTQLLIWKRTLLHSFALAVILSIQTFAGFPQTVFITVIGIILFTIAQAIADERLRNNFLRITLLIITSCIVAFLLSAVQILPTLAFLKNSLDPTGFDPDTASHFSFPLRNLATLISPYIYGSPENGTIDATLYATGDIFWESNAFVGPLSLLLLLGLFLTPRKKNDSIFIKTSLLLVFISFLLMWGKYSPFYILYSFWPFTLFRVPSRFLWIFVTFVVALASFGFSRITEKYFRGPQFRITAFGFVLLQTVILLRVWHGYHAHYDSKTWLEPPESITFLHPAGKIFTYGFTSADNTYFLSTGWSDVKPYVFLRNFLYPNSNAVWNIPSFEVYSGRFQRRHAYATELVTSSLQSDTKIATISSHRKFLDIYSIGTILSSIPITAKNLELSKKMSFDKTQLYIYQNSNVLPNVYIAQTATQSATLKKARSAFIAEDYVPNSTVLLSSPASISHEASGSAYIQSRSDATIRITLEKIEGTTYLVVKENYDPGWKAYVDNQSVKIIPANISQMAIPLERGNQQVLLTYNPIEYRVGVVISLLAYLSVLGYGIFTSKYKSGMKF